MAFKTFVLLAEMRTGSNHLEESLNQFAGVRCLGELFNPVFLGGQGQEEHDGWDMAARDRDPLGFLAHLQSAEGLTGFRYFHDHEPRVLEALLDDPHCAKLILRRDPLESYVSLKIARATGQWRMTNPAHRRSSKAHFDAGEFADLVQRQEAFQAKIRYRLAGTGQAPFDIAYSQINDVTVLNGLAAFLGVPARLEAPSRRLKRQNPAPLRDKVENPDEMDEALAQMGRERGDDVSVPPPTCDAVLPHLALAPGLPILLAALPGTDPAIGAWLAAEAGTALQVGMSEGDVRKWQNRNKAARSMAVVSHPVARAFRLYRGSEEGSLSRTGFVAFLAETQAALSGQGVEPRPEGRGPQSGLLAALADTLLPDAVLRAGEVAEALPAVWARAGLAAPESLPVLVADPALTEIYDEAVEAAVRKLYNSDYRVFGFRKWKVDRAP